MVESRTPLGFGVEPKTPKHERIFIGTSQIRSMSQGIIFKVSYIELGTPHKTRPYLFYQMKIQFWGKGRERDLEKKETNKIPT